MLSLVMIVKNEENTILKCLESTTGIVDEVIVVDTGSVDNTVKLASSFGAKIYNYTWNDNFSDARNFAIEKARFEWILVLDADEYISSVNIENLKEFMNGKPKIGRIKIISKYGEVYDEKYQKNWISRLFPRNLRYVGRIHEQLNSDLDRENIDLEVYHSGYFLTNKGHRNLNLLFKELESNTTDVYLLYQIAKEFRSIGEYQKERKFLIEAYNGDRTDSNLFNLIITDIIYNSIKVNFYDEIYEIIEKHYSEFDKYPDFHFALANLYMNSALMNFEKYGHNFLLIEKEYLFCLEIGDCDIFDSVKGVGTFLALYNLGVYYETIKNSEKAIIYYEESSKYGYTKALKRLNILSSNPE